MLGEQDIIGTQVHLKIKCGRGRYVGSHAHCTSTTESSAESGPQATTNHKTPGIDEGLLNTMGIDGQLTVNRGQLMERRW